MYRDGSSMTVSTLQSAATDIKDSAEAFSVGARYTSEPASDLYFDGKMDELRVWSDVRTEPEVSGNYDSELNGDEAGLVAYWKFNNSLQDETSNDNHLIDSGDPEFSTDVPFTEAAAPTAILQDILQMGIIAFPR